MLSKSLTFLASIVLLLAFHAVSASANFYDDAEITWGDGRAQVLEGGNLLTLSLDKSSGSGFQSKNEYLFGRFDMQLKLVPGNSAGTVTTFFLSSQGQQHDEIDFEFLGNATGEPYTVHTNVYAKGKGDKEQQFRLWFDPTSAFHTYSILWNPQRIIFSVDDTPIRVYSNDQAVGTPFPTTQPMRVYCSLWDAEDWATQGGRVKTDWARVPFVASYRDFKIDGCVAGQSCGSQPSSQLNSQAWQTKELDAEERSRLRWVQETHMIYNYCADLARFPPGLPQECNISTA